MGRRNLYRALFCLGIGLLGRAERAAGQPGGPPAPPVPPFSAPASSAVTLSLELLAPEVITPGQPLAYTIVVRNPGSTLATAVGVEQVLPPGCRLLLSEPRAATQNDRLRWDLGHLEAGGERSLRAELQASAQVDLPPPTVSFAPAAAHRTRSARLPLDVAVTGPDTVQRGDKVKFHIQVRNNGTTPIQQVLVRDQLPDGLHLPQGSFVEAEIGTLKAGEARTLPLEVTAAQVGRWINEVVALADGDLKADARINVTVIAPPSELRAEATSALVIELAAHEHTLRVDAETTYEIHVANQGSTAARQVRVTVRLPEGLALVRADGPTPVRPSPQEITFDPLPQLGPRKDAVYRVRLRGQHPGDWRWRIELSNGDTTRQLHEEVGVRVTDVQGISRQPLTQPR